jgi:hypothetical protein
MNRYLASRQVAKEVSQHKKLGGIQFACLTALLEHRVWPGGGWVWDNYSHTKRVLDSLARRGHVVTEPLPDFRRTSYTPHPDLLDRVQQLMKEGN